MQTLQDRAHVAAEISTALLEKAMQTPSRLVDRKANERGYQDFTVAGAWTRLSASSGAHSLSMSADFAKTLQDRTHVAADISTALPEKAMQTPSRLVDREANEL